MRVLAALLIVATFSAGCTSSAACPDAGLARTAYDAAATFLDGLGDQQVTVRLEGTIEGEVDTITLAFDPAARAVRIASASGDDFRKRGDVYSMLGDTSYYSRDYDPRLTPAEYAKQALGDDAEPDFAGNLRLEDYAATCVELGGVDALQFEYEAGGITDVRVVERDAPHRPLAAQRIDPALQDNFRVSFSHAAPTFQVQTELPRAPINVEFILVTQEDVGDGIVTTVRLGAGTEWAPIEEIDLAVVGNEAFDMGDLYNLYNIAAGEHDMDEGYYDYTDVDGNGLLSEGDLLEVALVYGYDFVLFDDWADAYTIWEFA